MTNQYYSVTPGLDTSPDGMCAPDHAPIEQSSGPRPTGADSRGEIRSVYAALSEHLGRPANVLDPGSGRNRPSPAFPSYPVTAKDVPDGCDLALCAVSGPNRDASDRVGLLSTALGLADTAGVLLFEMVWHDDPIKRHDVLPDDLERLRRAFAFVHTITEYDDNEQGCCALLFCSNRYWYADGRLGAFDSWTPYSNQAIGETRRGTRRYFFCADTVIKHYSFHGPPARDNRHDMEREISFLSNPPVHGLPIPRLIAHHICGRDGVLVMERLSGILLMTAVSQKTDYDACSVLRGVLECLDALESVGLYHNDVGQWNIIVNNDGSSTLIDFASITDELRSCHWPYDPVTQFFVFAASVFSRRPPCLSVALFPFKPFGFPRPLRRWAAHVWAHPTGKRNFALLKACFETALDKRPQDYRKSGISGRPARLFGRLVYWRSLIVLQVRFTVSLIKHGGLHPEVYRILGRAVRSFTTRPVTALPPVGRPRP